jgi:UDP-N-acetylmuramyl pentapeptide phosphotransferase/UDP-N-acetylglucosamine-1-phosphate transferase
MGFWAYAALACSAFVSAVVLCTVARDAALRRRLVDVPNERSLHKTPVPRLGGVGLTLAAWSVLVVGAAFVPVLDRRDTRICLGGSVVVALLGLVDDIRPQPAALRLLVQTLTTAVVLALAPLGLRVALAADIDVTLPHAVTLGVAVLFVVGATNIYNFMDGMDGLAALQAIGAGLALGCSAAMHGHADLAAIAWIVGAAAAGFLVRNFPPATLFLGDAGSTFLGFTFTALGVVAAGRSSPVPLGVVALALGPFLLDGTFTLGRRIRRREPVWRAHRTHLYQRAVATGLSHGQVLVVYGAWIAISAGGAVWAARGDGGAFIASWLATFGALAAVWRWVVGRERRGGSQKPLPP